MNCTVVKSNEIKFLTPLKNKYLKAVSIVYKGVFVDGSLKDSITVLRPTLKSSAELDDLLSQLKPVVKDRTSLLQFCAEQRAENDVPDSGLFGLRVKFDFCVFYIAVPAYPFQNDPDFSIYVYDADMLEKIVYPGKEAKEAAENPRNEGNYKIHILRGV